MNNEEYWAERQHSLNDRAMEKGAAFYERTVKNYDRAINGIQAKIEAFYGRFAKANQISFEEAKRLLTSNERDRFQMTLEEYLEKARTLNLSDEWAAELERASLVYRISRLDTIIFDMRQKVETLMKVQETSLEDLLHKVYEDGYYRQTHALNTAMGMGIRFDMVDHNYINKLLQQPWAADGVNFAGRFSEERTLLINTLNNRMVQGLMRGDDMRQIIADVADTMDTSKFRAGRLIMTETAFCNSVATKDAYTDQKVKRFKFIATLSERTCEKCGYFESTEQNQKGYLVEDYQPGLNAEPLHPMCRCTTIPINDSEDPIFGGLFDDVPGKRSTRDADGKYFLVDRNTTYAKWKENHVPGQ